MFPFKNRQILVFTGIFLVGLLFFTLYLHRVDNTISTEDQTAINTILNLYHVTPLSAQPTYSDQIDFILQVQKATLAHSPNSSGIPFSTPREPVDFVRLKQGLCYDRSRFIEKTLNSNGIQTRHIALYSTYWTGSKLKSLVVKKPGSHSLTEAKTKNGWIVVDSNAPWISLDKNNNPISISMIQSTNNFEGLVWSSKVTGEMDGIYKKGFTFVYGLYSRHGKFYPPYNFLPDINWSEFSQNFF